MPSAKPPSSGLSSDELQHGEAARKKRINWRGGGAARTTPKTMETIGNMMPSGQPSADLEEMEAIAKSFMTAPIHAVSSAVESSRGKRYYDLLLKKAMAIVIERSRSARLEILEAAIIHPAYPEWVKAIMTAEVGAREREKQRAYEQGQLAKEERQLKMDRRKPKAGSYRDKLLEADKYQSIFKVKYQFRDPIDVGGAQVRWIETRFSRDYEAERSWFSADKWEYLESRMASEDRNDTWRLFAPGGLKKGGFNGFNYTIEKSFKPMASQNKICWFGIYLNFVKEPQPNGEEYSMEVWSWGKMMQQYL